jgi:hypothetical protein
VIAWSHHRRADDVSADRTLEFDRRWHAYANAQEGRRRQWSNPHSRAGAPLYDEGQQRLAAIGSSHVPQPNESDTAAQPLL